VAVSVMRSRVRDPVVLIERVQGRCLERRGWLMLVVEHLLSRRRSDRRRRRDILSSFRDL